MNTLRVCPDFLNRYDESHVTLPQLQGMYAGDASRKNTLVEYGFRLPSAKDNRPLKYEEFSERIGPVIYTSATLPTRNVLKANKWWNRLSARPGLLTRRFLLDQLALEWRANKLLRMVLAGVGDPGNRGPEQKIVRSPSYPGQIQDFIKEIEKTIKKGFRVLSHNTYKKNGGKPFHIFER